jgi:hypothetical protein
MKRPGRNILLLSCLWIGISHAQENNQVQMPVRVSIPTVSLVGFAGSGVHTTNMAGKGAVQKITPATLDTTWLNYSSVVDGHSTNSLSASIASGNLPVEVVVKLKIGEDVGAGAGAMGKPTGEIALNEYPQVVVTDIGTCYTGLGPKKGHPITYTWEGLPPSRTDHPSEEKIEISVIYTLTSSK